MVKAPYPTATSATASATILFMFAGFLGATLAFHLFASTLATGFSGALEKDVVDWVGFEPTTTYVSSAVARHARQVFYRTKLPAHELKPQR